MTSLRDTAVDPQTWTHGSSAEQRQEWFSQGFGSGYSTRCDTFDERASTPNALGRRFR